MTDNASSMTGNELEAALGPIAPPSEEQKAAVQKMVLEAAVLKSRIEKGEALLKLLKGELNQLTSTALPAALASLGTDVFRLTEGDFAGWKVEVYPFIGGSLPKIDPEDDESEERRNKALDLIRGYGAEGIIKSQLNAEFAKGQDNLLGEVKAIFEKLEIDCTIETGVHPQTLLAFARERMANGEEIDMPALGLFPGRVAKIDPPKPEKIKKAPKAAKGK